MIRSFNFRIRSATASSRASAVAPPFDFAPAELDDADPVAPDARVLLDDALLRPAPVDLLVLERLV
jgi:hypothetical protein